MLDKARRIPRRYWLYYIPLIAAAVAFAIFLDEADRPWEKGVAAREAAGKSVKSIHHGISGLWYGAWVALGVIAVLAAAGPFALRKLTPKFRRTDAGLGKRSAPTFWIFGAIAVAMAAYELAPTLSHSLWGDEDYAVRRSIVGQWERNADNEMWFRESTWWDGLFAYKTPNNHFLFTIFARLSHGGYHPGDDPKKLHFDETRIRMPSFIAGLGAVLSLGYLVSVIGYRRAAIGAMFLLALHPWFLRHGAEARGYPLALFLSPLAITFMIKAVRRGRGVYWALFALFEALTFYAYPGTIYILTCVNLAALAHIYFARRDTDGMDKFTLASRWFAANTAAALPLVFLLMPVFKQLQGYVARSQVPGLIDLKWLWNNLSHMTTGIPWRHGELDNALRPMLSSTPVLSAAVVALFLGFGIAGIVRLVRGRHRWLAVVLALPYPLTIVHAIKNGAIVFQWYTITALPLFVASAAIGIEYACAHLKPLRTRTLAGFGLLVVLLGGYALFTRHAVVLQRENSVEQMRESVALTREVMNPFHPDIENDITVQFCQAARGYDPAVYFFRSDKKEPDGPERLKKLLLRADAEGKQLHVNLSMLALAQRDWSGLMEVVENTEWFERLPLLYGLQEPCTRYIYRYRRNSYQSDTASPPDGS